MLELDPHPRAPSPNDSMIEKVYEQYWIACATLAAANLDVANHLDRTPKHVEDIARSVGADPGCLFRLLRGLASVGIFREEGERRFVNTALSEQLRSDSSSRARAVIRMMGLKCIREAMAEYETAIRTGRSAFELVHGGSSFDVLRRRPEEAEIYHEGMASDGGFISAIVERVDFGGIGKLVDVGGGRGTLLARILQRNPEQRGVLFDLPEAVTGSVIAAHGLASRCDVRAGDMRREVPEGGDGYILKNIMHGWRDGDCVALLRRIGGAAVERARVFIIENVMPSGNEYEPCKVFDLFLLLGGSRARVRSAAEFRDLLEQAGFTLTRVVPIQGNKCAVEGRLRG